jgi:hypothetical protein
MKKTFIGIILAGIITISALGYVVFANPFLKRPWDGLTCDEMKQLAISPAHYNYTDAQHIEFHKELAKCFAE